MSSSGPPQGSPAPQAAVQPQPQPLHPAGSSGGGTPMQRSGSNTPFRRQNTPPGPSQAGPAQSQGQPQPQPQLQGQPPAQGKPAVPQRQPSPQARQAPTVPPQRPPAKSVPNRSAPPQHGTSPVSELQRVQAMYVRLNAHNDAMEGEFVRLKSVMENFTSGVRFGMRGEVQRLREELGSLRDSTELLLSATARDISQLSQTLMSVIPAVAGHPDSGAAPVYVTLEGDRFVQTSAPPGARRASEQRRASAHSYYNDPEARTTDSEQYELDDEVPRGVRVASRSEQRNGSANVARQTHRAESKWKSSANGRADRADTLQAAEHVEDDADGVPTKAGVASRRTSQHQQQQQARRSSRQAGDEVLAEEEGDGGPEDDEQRAATRRTSSTTRTSSAQRRQSADGKQRAEWNSSPKRKESPTRTTKETRHTSANASQSSGSGAASRSKSAGAKERESGQERRAAGATGGAVDASVTAMETGTDNDWDGENYVGPMTAAEMGHRLAQERILSTIRHRDLVEVREMFKKMKDERDDLERRMSASEESHQRHLRQLKAAHRESERTLAAQVNMLKAMVGDEAAINATTDSQGTVRRDLAAELTKDISPARVHTSGIGPSPSRNPSPSARSMWASTMLEKRGVAAANGGAPPAAPRAKQIATSASGVSARSQIPDNMWTYRDNTISQRARSTSVKRSDANRSYSMKARERSTVLAAQAPSPARRHYPVW